MREVYEAVGAGNGIKTRAIAPPIGSVVVGCPDWLGCTGTVANAVFHAELKGAGTVPGVN